MTGVVPVIPRFRFNDASGNPLVGGSVTVYLAGTTTLANTYQDNALTIANTNPVTLDANGECMFWVDSASTYKLLLKDAGGATVSGWPVDNIPGAADIGSAASAAAAAAASYASAASVSATSAATSATQAQTALNSVVTAAATTGAYPNTAATNVPRGLTQASVGAITAGAGGTNGTFTVGWSGGNFSVNPTATFTVAGGALTAVTITGPGLYIGSSPTIPTPSFAASAGLAGAAVALTIQFLITSGNGYWVTSADGTQFDRYVNSSGTATRDTNTASIPTTGITNGLKSAAAMLLPGMAVPTGWRSAGDTVDGMTLIVPTGLPDLNDLFSGGEAGVAIIPNSSSLFQGWPMTTAAAASGDLVKTITDLSPNRRCIVAPSDSARPTLRISGGATYLEFDTTDDQLRVPKRAVNQSAMYVCFSADLRTLTGAATPTVFGDLSTTSGFYAGFTSLGVPRIAVAGGTTGTVVATGPAVISLATRYTWEFFFDGADMVITQDGTEIKRQAAPGAFGVGSQPLIGYNQGSIHTPVNLYGLIAIGRIPNSTERAYWRALVASNNQALNRFALEQMTATTERAAHQTAVGQIARYYGLSETSTTKGYMLGDSTSDAFNGLTTTITFINTIRTRVNLATSGNTIAQQKTAWQGQTIVVGNVGWVCVGPLGHNNLDPSNGQTRAQIIAAYQDLVTTIRTSIGASKPILICSMIPCAQRLTNLYGVTTDSEGKTAQERFQALQDAIGGLGATPITGADARVTSFTTLLDDGTGKLLSDFDTFFDGIHANDFARKWIIAPAIETALNTLGVGI